MLRLITKHREYGEFRSPSFLLRTAHFYAAALSSPSESALGITVSKRIGKAHVRNLLKRRIKAWARLPETCLPAGCKFNLIAKQGAGELTWPQLCQELNALMDLLREKL